jgi:hypothetical protein
MPSAFFELLGESAAAAEGYKFTSEEIKETAFRIDGLFEPAEDAPEKPIYIMPGSTVMRCGGGFIHILLARQKYLGAHPPLQGYVYKTHASGHDITFSGCSFSQKRIFTGAFLAKFSFTSIGRSRREIGVRWLKLPGDRSGRAGAVPAVFACRRVRRVCLDELGETADRSVGAGMIQLIVEPSKTAGERARGLIQQAQQTLTDEALDRGKFWN